METYLCVMILFFGFVFVMAIIQAYAYLLLQQANDLPENNILTLHKKPEPHICKSNNPKRQTRNNWIFSERNLHKAILKGRRNGHLQIMYHGKYYATGLKIVTPCQ